MSEIIGSASVHEQLARENTALKAELVEWQTGDRRYHPDVLAEELRERCREVNTLKAELAALKEEADKDYAGMREFQGKFIVADRELRALKAQEPVGYFCKNHDDDWDQVPSHLADDLEAVPLYTAPQPAVPAKTCICGVPQSLGIVHSADTPCYYAAPEAPQAQAWEDGLCPYCYQTLKESK